MTSAASLLPLLAQAFYDCGVEEHISPESNLSELNARVDSLERMEIIAVVELETGVDLWPVDLARFASVRELLDYIVEQQGSKR